MNIIYLSYITAGSTALAVLIKRIHDVLIGAITLRAAIFFKGRLADLKFAKEHVRESRHDAIVSISEDRTFRFLFGFSTSGKVRDAVFKALAQGLISEREVRLCNFLLKEEPNDKLMVKDDESERPILWLTSGMTIAMFAMMALLLLLTHKEAHGDWRVVAVGLCSALVAFGTVFACLNYIGKIILIQGIRRRLKKEIEVSVDDKNLAAEGSAEKFPTGQRTSISSAVAENGSKNYPHKPEKLYRTLSAVVSEDKLNS